MEDKIKKYVNRQIKYRINKDAAINMASIKFNKSEKEIKEILGEKK